MLLRIDFDFSPVPESFQKLHAHLTDPADAICTATGDCVYGMITNKIRIVTDRYERPIRWHPYVLV